MPRFPKKERLCSKKAIDWLFCNGKYISEKPIRFVWNLEKKQKDSCSTKVLISVSKKSLKSSVDRNKIKRKLKYAVQKISEKGKVIDLNYTYVIFGKNNVYKDNFLNVLNKVNDTFKKIIEMKK